MDIKTYLNNVCKEIKYEPAKKAISEELELHIKEVKENYINDGIDEVVGYGDIIDKAINREVTKEDIVKCVNKLGNTPFKINDIEVIKDDNIFISLSNLNQIRREVVDKLIVFRKNKKKEVIIREIDDINEGKVIESKININVLVRNEEQLKCCLDNNIDSIYVGGNSIFVEEKEV